MGVEIVGSTGEKISSRLDYYGVDFCQELRDRGFTISVPSSNHKMTALVAFNHSPEALQRATANSVPISARVLIAEEPPPVRPDQYQKAAFNNYGHVICTSKFLASLFVGVNTSVVRIADWPSLQPMPSLDEYRARENSACLVQANKFSCVTGENYTLRRSLIALAQKKKIPIAVYGEGWNQGWKLDWWQFRWALSNARRSRALTFSSFAKLGIKVRDFRGSLDSKQDAFDSHRISLVIENFNGYASEKILDSLAGGILTLYVGTDLEQYGFPDNIAVLAKPDAKDLAATLDYLLSIPVEVQYRLLREQHGLSSILMSRDASTVHQRLAAQVAQVLT